MQYQKPDLINGVLLKLKETWTSYTYLYSTRLEAFTWPEEIKPTLSSKILLKNLNIMNQQNITKNVSAGYTVNLVQMDDLLHHFSKPFDQHFW